MNSSVQAYAAAQFNYDSIRTQRWFNLTIGGGNSPLSQGYDFEGMFTIPVCHNANGNFISATASQYI